MMRLFWQVCAVAIIFHLTVVDALALEIVTVASPHTENDQREMYVQDVLRAILDHTVDDYGAYEIAFAIPMRRKRIEKSLESGVLDVQQLAYRPEYSEKYIPVRIPVFKGLLGYRLFLIHQKNQALFSQLETLEALKQLRSGLGSAWSITPLFRDNGFNVVAGNNYDGLFKMLIHGRFDYFARGLNEIGSEYEQFHAQYPEMAVEQDLILYVPLPAYYLVTPGKPHLAKRINTGFEAIVRNGVFDDIFMKYYANLVNAYDLESRRIFRIDNPNLSDADPLDRKEFWYHPGQAEEVSSETLGAAE